MKFEIISKTIIIILLIGLIIAPSLNALENYTADQEKEISETVDNLESYDIYRFCYVESGDVDHDQFSFYRLGFFCPAPPGFGIGRVGVNLIGWRDVTRLTVTNIFGTKTNYEYDVGVYVRGFIGYAWPTVSIYGGILKGRALIAKVSPVN